MFVTIPKNYILYKSVLNKYVREGLLVHSKDCNRMAWFSDTYKKANYSGEGKILIDDRLEPNIEMWRSKGGIGIHHTSASDTISQLKELGL
jgi:hypothetical protein